MKPSVDDGAYECELLRRAAEWPGGESIASLSVDALRCVATDEGIDLATALIFDRLCRSERHGPFIVRLNEWKNKSPGSSILPGKIALVPGGFHGEHRHTGADGAALLEELRKEGFPVEVIPTPSFGRVAEGAAAIRHWLQRNGGDRTALVSLSKGSAEVKLALNAPDAAEVFRNVAAWIDLSGMLEGTPLIDWLLRQRLRWLAVRSLFWWRGYAAEALYDMRRQSGGLLDRPLSLPAGMPAVHVVGFPLQRHLSCPLAQRGHRRLAHLGPNDGGGILLADVLTRPGWIYPVWGADHYLRPQQHDLRPLIGRLLCLLSEPGTVCKPCD